MHLSQRQRTAVFFFNEPPANRMSLLLNQFSFFGKHLEQCYCMLFCPEFTLVSVYFPPKKHICLELNAHENNDVTNKQFVAIKLAEIYIKKKAK